MNFYPTLSMIHFASALLLFSLAIISVLIAVLIAVKPAADQLNRRLLNRANAVGQIEQIVLGFVTLSGVIAALMNSWSLTQPWLWMSLMIVVFYSLALQFITKPARLAVAEGGSMVKAGLQVGLQIGHVMFLLVAFALMMLRPL